MNDLFEYDTTTGTGWVCPGCNTFIAHGQAHVCPGRDKEQEEPKYKISFSSDGADLATAINNLARAVQRLADVLGREKWE